MKRKVIVAVIVVVAVALVGVVTYIILSGKDDERTRVTKKPKTEAEIKELYKGPDVIKRTVKLKNIPRFKKIMERQNKKKKNSLSMETSSAVTPKTKTTGTLKKTN